MSALSTNPVAKVLVFDSGLGGLTVFRELRLLRSQADYLYVADDAAFPYGRHAPDVVTSRVVTVMDKAIAQFQPDIVVIACNTASTLVMGPLRARWPQLPFVGTVPAIKPAAEQTRSGMFSVLATPGTVARDYTHDLVRQFAEHCDVALVGSKRLAVMAEAFMHGDAVDDSVIWSEIAPCFVAQDGRRTDVVVLACTHYPLLLAAFKRLAPWPVIWIDSGNAIARRADHVLQGRFPAGGELFAGPKRSSSAFALTSGASPSPQLWTTLRGYGFEDVAECRVAFFDT